MRVDVLGPIRARDGDGRDVTPDGALQRRLLALLVLRRGRIVSTDAAIDVLWPSTPPRDPVAALQNHMFRLRRGLPEGVIDSTGDGYCLAPAAVELDADRLAAALHAADTDRVASDAIDAVIDGWTGPAYPELDDVDDGRAEAIRLDELRTRARELRAERRLAAGATDGLVAEVAALVEDDPLRERPRALLMAALATTGRHVEALRVYDDFRRLLGDELGIEPSPSLAAQHAVLLAGPAGPAGAAWTPATRLPVAATSLVGRDALADEITAMVGPDRLVTLVGPGGVGKTRLLGEVGRRLRAARPECPVVMCELATATTESAVDVVAAALVIDGRPGVPIAERVTTVLADAEVVLLLDNCEHVLDPIAELVERLLASCPNATIVATSRERLRVPAERVGVVPTLPSSDGGGPAVELFVERARAVAPGFVPDAGELAVIADVVHRLDGLPLAIELAAARLHTHDVGEVAVGLDHRFELLSSGYRTSSRHGSLAAAVSWSFGLLDDRLRRTFADLSVFAGSFTAADAAAICDLDTHAANAALHQLAERSLVTRAPDRRFVLLETLRAFGAEQLLVEGRAEEVAERHARHQVDWTARADHRLAQEAEQPVIAEIDAALPELRAAFGWLLDHGEVELAGRLVADLIDYAFFRLRPDVLAWADRVREADPDDRSPLAAVSWAASGYAAWMAGDVAEAGARGFHALRVTEHSGARLHPEVATICGSFELFQGNLDGAAAWFERARDAAGDDLGQEQVAKNTYVLALGYTGDPAAVEAAATLLADVGDARTPYAAYAWYCAGEADSSVNVERARARLVRALELAELTNASFVTGVAGASKASIDARFGDPVAAADDYRWLINHWRRAGMWSAQWTMLRSIAGLLDRLGRPGDAAVLLGAVRSTQAGHRIFGEDEAALTELALRLRAELGDDAYAAALDEGAGLDGDAATEHALHAL